MDALQSLVVPMTLFETLWGVRALLGGFSPHRPPQMHWQGAHMREHCRVRETLSATTLRNKKYTHARTASHSTARTPLPPPSPAQRQADSADTVLGGVLFSSYSLSVPKGHLLLLRGACGEAGTLPRTTGPGMLSGTCGPEREPPPRPAFARQTGKQG